MRVAVKCPSCGYVGYMKIERCIRCGYRAGSPASVSGETVHHEIANEAPESTSLSLPDSNKSRRNAFGSDVEAMEKAGASNGDVRESFDAPRNSSAALDGVELIAGGPREAETELASWRSQLSQTLDRVRERRAQARNGTERGSSLQFEFGKPAEEETTHVTASNAGPAGRARGQATIKDAWRRQPLRGLGTSAGDSTQEIEPEAREEQWSLDLTETPELRGQSLDDEVELIASQAGTSTISQEIPPIETAPLGPRFLAGVLDALILLAGAGLFGTIFWGIGGRLSLKPADLAISGSIALILGLAYFGCFTAAASGTPGMLLANLEVRNLDGGPPSVAESLSRALGYLVSTSALMLGFVWAAVDSEGMTWHDRMSGTFVSTRDSE
jgi:uncharacterized RDD family membrane protein YckC